MEQYYQMAQKIASASQRGTGTIRHNLARDFDYEYIIWRLGGEDLLKKKYHQVYQMLQETRGQDLKMAEKGECPMNECEADGTGLTDAMNIRTLNFHPQTTLESTSCMDMTRENPSIVIIGDVSDVVSKKSVDGFAINDNYSSYLTGGIKVPAASLIRGQERHFLATSTFYWTEQDEEGKPLLRSKTDVSDVVKIIGASSLVTSMTVEAPMPMRHIGGQKTTIYYNRKGILDDSLWDYYYEKVGTTPENISVHMPFKGSATFLDGFTPKPYIDRNEDFFLYIENKKNGVANFNLSQMSAISLRVSGQTISWEFPIDWKTTIAKKALTGAQQLTFYAHMHIMTEKGISVPLTIQSDGVTHEDPSYAKIPKIDILWGCFAKDTHITMADGSEKMVCEIRPGEQVRTRNGNCKVEDLIQGPEERLVLIRSVKGNVIRLTENHPLLTTEGIKMAKDLTWGSILEMEYGRDAIEELHMVEYHDTVYSLLLADEEFLIADGYFAGDFKAQNRVMKEAEAAAKEEKNRKLAPFQQELNELITSLAEEKGERHEREYGERSL